MRLAKREDAIAPPLPPPPPHHLNLPLCELEPDVDFSCQFATKTEKTKVKLSWDTECVPKP